MPPRRSDLHEGHQNEGALVDLWMGKQKAPLHSTRPLWTDTAPSIVKDVDIKGTPPHRARPDPPRLALYALDKPKKGRWGHMRLGKDDCIEKARLWQIAHRLGDIEF